MSGENEIDEEITKIRSQTEFDAVHPRFKPEDPIEVLKFQIKNDYYCEYCREFFAPTFTGLQTHFDGVMVEHKPVASCFYCKGNVYEYRHNQQKRVHHNCREYSKSKSSCVNQVC